jgi:hypothetical protein
MNRGETSVKIQEAQWDKFWDIFPSMNNLSAKEKQFIQLYGQPDGFNQLWLQTFRDCLSEALGFSEKGSYIIYMIYIINLNDLYNQERQRAAESYLLDPRNSIFYRDIDCIR